MNILRKETTMNRNMCRMVGLALLWAAPALLLSSMARAQDAPADKPAEAPQQATRTYDAQVLYTPIQNCVGVQDPLDNTEQNLASYYYALSAAPEDPAAPDRPFLITAFHDPADATLGATLEPLGDAVRAQLGLDGKTGLLVADLANDGPAAGAGLQRNDILLTLSDAALGAPGDVTKRLKTAGEKEKTLELKLMRAGKPMTLRVRPVTRVTLGPAEPEKTSYYIGVSASPIDDVLRLHIQLPAGRALPAGQGLLVTEVVSGSPAEKAGVKQHDVLLTLKDKPLDRSETLAAQVQAVGDKPATLSLIRAGKPLSLAVTPEPRKDEAAAWQAANVRLWNYRAHQVGLNQPRTFDSWTRHPAAPNHAAETHAALVGQLAKGHASSNAPAAATNPTAQRLDALDKEIKALRQAIEEMRDTLKKER
jgi:C-terminal processing protease CtpA/Prc